MLSSHVRIRSVHLKCDVPVEAECDVPAAGPVLDVEPQAAALAGGPGGDRVHPGAELGPRHAGPHHLADHYKPTYGYQATFVRLAFMEIRCFNHS